MFLAEKANRRVKIADEKKDEYIGMGYTVKNMDGSLVQAPQDHKKRVQELEAELKTVREEAEQRILQLTEELKKAKADADVASGALAEASTYAEKADKRIAELEAELKMAKVAEPPKKEAKPKQTDK